MPIWFAIEHNVNDQPPKELEQKFYHQNWRDRCVWHFFVLLSPPRGLKILRLKNFGRVMAIDLLLLYYHNWNRFRLLAAQDSRWSYFNHYQKYLTWHKYVCSHPGFLCASKLREYRQVQQRIETRNRHISSVGIGAKWIMPVRYSGDHDWTNTDLRIHSCKTRSNNTIPICIHLALVLIATRTLFPLY